MAKMIDTEQAWKTAQKVFSDPVLLHAIRVVLDKTSPTVDAVEVVRCKNCVHYNGEGCLKTYGEFEPEPTFYCAYGERRDKDAVD